ncbi:MAG: TRAP transporter small permease [Oscillospiraceae bacterium]|nr:TRAP transporter small permease [Oscillospiraceae bacterium]
MIKAIKWLDKNFEKYILVFLLILITGVLSLQVFMRFVVNSPTFWSDRVAQLSLVISTFFSISYCIRRGSSLKIDLLIKAVPAPVAKVMAVLVKVIMLVLFSLLAAASWGTLGQYVERGTTDAALGIPIQYFYMVVFFALSLAVVRCVQALIFEFFPEKNPEVLVTMISKPADPPAKDTTSDQPVADNE